MRGGPTIITQSRINPFPTPKTYSFILVVFGMGNKEIYLDYWSTSSKVMDSIIKVGPRVSTTPQLNRNYMNRSICKQVLTVQVSHLKM